MSVIKSTCQESQERLCDRICGDNPSPQWWHGSMKSSQTGLCPSPWQPENRHILILPEDFDLVYPSSLTASNPILVLPCSENSYLNLPNAGIIILHQLTPLMLSSKIVVTLPKFNLVLSQILQVKQKKKPTSLGIREKVFYILVVLLISYEISALT